MVKVFGKEIKLVRDNSRFGYSVSWIDEEGVEHACWLSSRGENDYIRVWFGTSSEVRKGKRPEFCYLHKIVYAYYMKWNRLDVMENQEIHHIDGNKRNNVIWNLIALPKEIHTAYHSLIRKSLREENTEVATAIFRSAQKLLEGPLVIRQRRIEKIYGKVIKNA